MKFRNPNGIHVKPHHSASLFIAHVELNHEENDLMESLSQRTVL
jgi:hypothetical protein